MKRLVLSCALFSLIGAIDGANVGLAEGGFSSGLMLTGIAVVNLMLCLVTRRRMRCKGEMA